MTLGGFQATTASGGLCKKKAMKTVMLCVCISSFLFHMDIWKQDFTILFLLLQYPFY